MAAEIAKEYPVSYVGNVFKNITKCKAIVSAIAWIKQHGSKTQGQFLVRVLRGYPIRLLLNRAVLVVEPTGKTASSETRRINGAIRLNRLQEQTALGNQISENRSQRRVFKVVGNAVEVRNLGDITAPVGFSQVAHEATLRNSRINFENNVENYVPSAMVGLQFWAPAVPAGAK
jgi:hypothetical protein